MTQASSVAIAGGAITTALINVLIAKGVLSESEAVDVGYRAQNLIATDTSAEAAEARRIIAEMLIGQTPSPIMRP
jgi:hypothetical protein